MQWRLFSHQALQLAKPQGMGAAPSELPKPVDAAPPPGQPLVLQAPAGHGSDQLIRTLVATAGAGIGAFEPGPDRGHLIVDLKRSFHPTLGGQGSCQSRGGRLVGGGSEQPVAVQISQEQGSLGPFDHEARQGTTVDGKSHGPIQQGLQGRQALQGGGLTQEQQGGGFLVEARQQSRRLGFVERVGSKKLGGQQLGSQQAFKA